jgi:hypothetical protein
MDKKEKKVRKILHALIMDTGLAIRLGHEGTLTLDQVCAKVEVDALEKAVTSLKKDEII